MDNLPQEPKKQEEKSVWGQTLSLAWDLGYLIAIPLVVLALLGRFLDSKFHTSPLLLLVGIVLSVLVTTVGLYRKISRLTK